MSDEDGSSKRGLDISKLMDLPEPNAYEQRRLEEQAKETLDSIHNSGVFDIMAEHQKQIEEFNRSVLPSIDAMKPSLDDAMTGAMGLGDAISNSGVLSAMDSLKGIGTGGVFDGLSSLGQCGAAFGDALAEINGAGIHDRMQELVGGVNSGSALEQVARDIDRQQTAIDRLGLERIQAHIHEPIALPDLQNPIVETNDRLARIEQQFDKVFAVAKDSAQVANGLQAAAAEFLEKFQKEADKNNEAVSKTIRVAWLSLGAVVIFAVAQIAAPLFLPDQQTEALQTSVVELRSEVEALRETQAAVSDRLVEALASSDAQTAAALLSIVEQLKSTSEASASNE